MGGGPSYFLLDQKVTKSQVSRKASFRSKPHRTSRQNHGLQPLAAFALLPMLQAKIAMPLPAHKATIVLPAFGRSCPADVGGNLLFN